MPSNIAPTGSATASDPVTYAVAVTNSNLTNNAGVSSPQLTAAVPTGNPSLQISASDPLDGITSGSMTFELFENLVPTAVSQVESVVNQVNTGMTFYRVVNQSSFQIIQGSFTSSTNTGSQWDDIFEPNLQFTSAGVLAMANSGPDTNTSQFFITGQAQRSLDFRYTIFGFMTQETGSLLQAIEKVPVTTNSSTGEDSQPVNTVSITGISIVHATRTACCSFPRRRGPAARPR